MCVYVCVLTGLRTDKYDRLMRWWSYNPQSGIAQVLDYVAYCDVILPRRPCYTSPHCSYQKISSAHLGVPYLRPNISAYHTRLFYHLGVSRLCPSIPTHHPTTSPPSGSYRITLYLNLLLLLSSHKIPDKVPQSCFYVASWIHQD